MKSNRRKRLLVALSLFFILLFFLPSGAGAQGGYVPVAIWGSKGSEEEEFNYPFGIATDAAGYVYVADTYNHRIQKFDSGGTFLTQWGSSGDGDGQFSHPCGIATDAAGYVYVADTNNDRIQKFDSGGTFLTQWGSYGTGEGQFYTPCGIATDASGNVYVVDTYNHRIQKFSPDTTKPWVENLTLDPASPVKTGLVTFTLVFSEDMDTSVLPTVTFGKTDPYDEHTIGKTSYSGKTWIGTFPISTGYDGKQHLSISGAKDLADNIMDTNISHTFLVDTTKPTVSITDPSANQTVSSASYTIKGEAADNGGSGIAKVEVTINDGSTWNEATITHSWSYAATLAPSANVVKARSIDLAGNVSDETPGITLTYETDKPTVKSLTLDPVSPVTVGEVTFTIVFSENMDITISPTVTFGKTDPYNERTIDRTSYSADTWVGTFPISTGYDGKQHLSISGAQDLADNIMDTDASHTFLVDTTSPGGSISINGGAAYTNSQSVTLSLSAEDAAQMHFSNDNSSWSTWEPYSTSKSWTLSSDDGEKTVSVQFQSSGGGISDPYSDTIILDTTKPTVTITDPSENQTVSSASYTIKGEAADNGGSGIAKVEVTINDGSTWNEAKDTNPWTYAATLVAGPNVVKARSIDFAGNVSDETPGITLTYETTKPTVISLTLNPPSPVKAGEVTFTIVFSEDMDTNTSPTVTFGKKDPYDEHTIGKTSYSGKTWIGTFPISTGYDGEQHLSISGAQDLADNIMDTDTSHTFLVDTTSPGGSISINGGATYTNSQSVTLSLSAEDAAQMHFSNDNSSWSSWESYSSSKSWTLSSGDGEKTVYVQFKDSADNVSKTYSDSIILHRTPPTVAITSPCAGSCLRGEVTVEGTATDDYFEKYEIEFAEGLNPSSWHEITSCCFPVVEAELCCWNVNSLSDGTYTLKLTAWDLASNFAEVKVVLKVDNHPPETTLIEYPLKKVTGNIPKALVPFSWTGSDPDNITPVEELVYQYRLEGHSTYQDWSGWSKDSASTFLLPSGGYTFKVRAKDEAGNYPAEDDAETARYSFTVSLPLIIYPNPCYLNQAGIVTFSNLPLESEVRIYIYDLGGSLVRTLQETDAVIQGGSKVVTWDLRNNKAEILTRGIYIYYILSATEKRTGKIAIIN